MKCWLHLTLAKTPAEKIHLSLNWISPTGRLSHACLSPNGMRLNNTYFVFTELPHEHTVNTIFFFTSWSKTWQPNWVIFFSGSFSSEVVSLGLALWHNRLCWCYIRAVVPVPVLLSSTPILMNVGQQLVRQCLVPCPWGGTCGKLPVSWVQPCPVLAAVI